MVIAFIKRNVEMTKQLSIEDKRAYQKRQDELINELKNLKESTDKKKKEIIQRLIEVTEPLIGYLDELQQPEQLSEFLLNKLSSNGLDDFITPQYFHRLVPDHLKRKYPEKNLGSSFFNYGKSNSGQKINISSDQKRIQLEDGRKYKLEDIHKENEKIAKQASREILKEELKESIVVECIRTSKEFIQQFDSFLDKFEDKFRENPKILEDFEKTLEFQELYDMCTKLKTLYDGEGSIIHQMHQETNFRAPASILQLALAKTLGIMGTFRQWAAKLSVSPRQYQRIRSRLSEWPMKRAADVIRKALGSVMCPNCQFNLVSRKAHPKVEVVDSRQGDELDCRVYLGNTEHTVPKEFTKYGMNPIEVCEQIFLKKLKVNS